MREQLDKENSLVSREERRRMKEVGTKACMVGKIVKIRMKWAGHMVRMEDGRLPKSSAQDKQTRRLQKTRNTTAKMGGLSEEI